MAQSHIENLSPFVVIVLLNYNGLEDTRICLNSIEQINTRPLQVIVVDNASQDDPSEILKREFPWCVVVRSGNNEGWAGGNNIGIRYALDVGAEFIILLNNDTIVSDEIVTRLVDAAHANPEFGIIGPVINEMSHPDQVQTDGCLFNRPEAFGFFQRKVVSLNRSTPPTVTEVDIVNGCCMMISKRVFDTIGLIDERFFLIHEESDFCLRAHEAGFCCGVIGESLVWHKHSASFVRAGNWRQRYYDTRNLFLLLRKHPSTSFRRSKTGSWLAYFKYIYYCYCLEREQQSELGARAVVQGFCDALYGRLGPHAPRVPFTYRLMHGIFEAAWLWRGRKAAVSDPVKKELCATDSEDPCSTLKTSKKKP